MSMRIAAAVIAALIGASAQAQDARPPATKVVTKTLVKSEAQKECFSLVGTQVLYYRFRADAPVDFKLSHLEDREIVDIGRQKVSNGAGSYVSKSKKTFDYCLVWTNTGTKSVTLHYEFQRGQ